MLEKDVNRFLKKYSREDIYVFVRKFESKKIVECKCKSDYGFLLSNDNLMSDFTKPVLLCAHQFQYILTLHTIQPNRINQPKIQHFKCAMICEHLPEKESVIINNVYWPNMYSLSLSAEQLQILNVDELKLSMMEKEELLIILALLHTNRLKCFTTRLDWLDKYIFKLFNLTCDFQEYCAMTLTDTTIKIFIERPYSLMQEKQYDYDEVGENFATNKN